MTMFRSRTATLAGAALAFSLFAAPGFAAAGSETRATSQTASQAQSADDSVSRIRRNRQMGFGRRGGDR